MNVVYNIESLAIRITMKSKSGCKSVNIPWVAPRTPRVLNMRHVSFSFRSSVLYKKLRKAEFVQDTM